MPVENFTTSVDNIKQDSPEWVTEKIRTELSSLQKEMFYTVKDNGEVECDISTVKSYLESIKNLNWSQLKEKGAAWAMAVQIALESIKDNNGNSKYDVGVIDGQFGSKTRSAVRKFQEDCGFTGKDLDGYAGKVTIAKLLEKLGGGTVVGDQGDQEHGGSASENGNVDIEGLDSKDWNFNGKVRKVYTVGLQKISETTWTDDKRVYAVNLSTKTKGNVLVGGGKDLQYRFMNDGTCYRITKDGLIQQGPLESSKVLDHLKANKPEISSTAEKNRVIDSIKTSCQDALKLDNGDFLGIKLNRSGTPVLTLEYKKSGGIPYSFEEPVNLSSCLANPQGEVDLYYTKNVVIEEAKQILYKKKKTYKCYEAIKRIYGTIGSKSKFSKEQLFSADWLSRNPLVDARLNTFFGGFENKQWELDKDFAYDAARYQINLEFDNISGNKTYNKWQSNGNLLMRGADKLVDDNYNFKDDEFKKNLRDIILRTVTKTGHPDFGSVMDTPKYD